MTASPVTKTPRPGIVGVEGFNLMTMKRQRQKNTMRLFRLTHMPLAACAKLVKVVETFKFHDGALETLEATHEGAVRFVWQGTGNPSKERGFNTSRLWAEGPRGAVLLYETW